MTSVQQQQKQELIQQTEAKLAKAWADLFAIKTHKLSIVTSAPLAIPSTLTLHNNWTNNVLPECMQMAQEFTVERQTKIDYKRKLVPVKRDSSSMRDAVRDLFSTASPALAVLNPVQQFTLNRLVDSNNKSMLVCEYTRHHHLLTICAWLKHCAQAKRRVLVFCEQDDVLEYAFALFAVYCGDYIDLHWKSSPQEGAVFSTDLLSLEDFNLVIAIGCETDWGVLAPKGEDNKHPQVLLLVDAKAEQLIDREWFEPPDAMEEPQAEEESKDCPQQQQQANEEEDEPAAKRAKIQEDEEDLSQLLFEASASPGLKPLAGGGSSANFDMDDDLSQLLLCPSPQASTTAVTALQEPTHLFIDPPAPQPAIYKRLATPLDGPSTHATDTAAIRSKVLLIETCVPELPKLLSATRCLHLVSTSSKQDRLSKQMEWIQFSSGAEKQQIEVDLDDLQRVTKTCGFLFELDAVVVADCLISPEEWSALSALFAAKLVNKRVHVFRHFTCKEHCAGLEALGLWPVQSTAQQQAEKTPLAVLKTSAKPHPEASNKYFSGKLPMLPLRRYCASVPPAVVVSLAKPQDDGLCTTTTTAAVVNGESHRFVVSFFDRDPVAAALPLPPPAPKPFSSSEDAILKRMSKNIKMCTDMINRSRFKRRHGPGQFRTVKQVEERVLQLKQQNLLSGFDHFQQQAEGGGAQDKPTCREMVSMQHLQQVLQYSERCRPKPSIMVHPNRGLLDRVLKEPPAAASVRFAPKQFLPEPVPKKPTQQLPPQSAVPPPQQQQQQLPQPKPKQ